MPSRSCDRRGETSLLVNDDAPAAQGGRGIRAVQSAELIVVDDRAAVAVPDLDAEPVHASAACDLPVDGGQEEPEIARAVDGPGALVLGARSGDHQPVIAGAVKAEAGYLELEFRLAGGDGRPSLVAGNEAEAGLAGQAGADGIGTGR